MSRGRFHHASPRKVVRLTACFFCSSGLGAHLMKSAFLILIVAFVLLGCGSGSPSDSSAAQTPKNDSANPAIVASDSKGIQSQLARPTEIPEYLDLPAHIEPDPTRVVHVFAPVGGRIVEVKVRPWDHVEKGQTLAALSRRGPARARAR